MRGTKINKLYEPAPDRRMSIVIMLSGSGTNFQSIRDEETRLGSAGAEIKSVFTNVPGCAGSEKADAAGIPVVSISSKRFFDTLGRKPDDEEARDYYDAAVISLIEQTCAPDLPDFIVLAGYRRKPGRLFLRRYENRVLNMYPGDITKEYLVRGVDASVQALRAGETSLKCTAYLERHGERFGRALAQSSPVLLGGFTENDKDKLNLKIREEAEWKLFPFVVHDLLARGRAAIDPDGNIYIDGTRQGAQGFQMGTK